jgi:hypothetical protein
VFSAPVHTTAPSHPCKEQPSLSPRMKTRSPCALGRSAGWAARKLQPSGPAPTELRWCHGTGRFIVGDRIDTFAPGHLVLVGPNLPHDWISDVAPGESLKGRDVVL